ncbi:hypothetical protein FF100_19140 [Methylobacterium terricola]|uniref:Uncharacterized protein n=1 Tax=Methylobacterium terricola TaxID=2583531 RepID=A0A5C4LFK2_9HYPH|nr:hypothetical protein [Methylobacterium terricola]TNC11753.1 hypothetical protein FF100_19140 [Methylobacterium terricola]
MSPRVMLSPRTVIGPGRVRPLHQTGSSRPRFTHLPNGLDLHAPPLAPSRPLLPRRVSASTLALVIVALAGWAGLLAWTRLDPVAPACPTCLSEPGQL